MSSTMSLSSTSLIVGVVLIIVSLTQGQTLTGPCRSLNEIFSHPTDCTRYIQCVEGQPLDRPCAPGTVFSPRSSVCVLRWNRFSDLCLKKEEFTPTMCSAALLPHPSKCHQYYNCTGLSTLIRVPLPYGREVEEDYVYECPYPQLFNEVTLRCEDYQNVQCGQKLLPLDACEYTRNQCQLSHCIPCDVRTPSCRGLADGVNVHRGKLWSPSFAVCKDQRLVNTSTCLRDDRLGVAQLFSPDLGRCASMYEIAVERGGYFLNCTGRTDGMYPDDVTNRPNLYFRCISGTRTEISLCPGGQYFDAVSSLCVARI